MIGFTNNVYYRWLQQTGNGATTTASGNLFMRFDLVNQKRPISGKYIYLDTNASPLSITEQVLGFGSVGYLIGGNKFKVPPTALLLSANTYTNSEEESRYSFMTQANIRYLFGNTGTKLIPPSTVDVFILNPEIVQVIGSDTNTGAAGNPGSFIGILELPKYAPNLEHIAFNVNGNGSVGGPRTAITGFTGHFPPKLKSFFCGHRSSGEIGVTIAEKFPATLESLIVFPINLSNFNTLIEDCVNLKTIWFSGRNLSIGTHANFNYPHTTLDISHCKNIEYLCFSSIALTNFNYDFSEGKLVKFNGGLLTALTDQQWLDLFDAVVSSPVLEWFSMMSSQKSVTRDLTNSNLPTSLKIFYLDNNRFTGTINLTNDYSSIQDFRLNQNLNRNNATKHTFTTINVSGLTGATILDLSAAQAETITLPNSTTLTQLNVGGNALTASFLSELSKVPNLTILRLNTGGLTGTNSDAGQNSTLGIDTNPDFSGLSSLIDLDANACKIKQNITINNNLSELNLINNPQLENISGVNTFSFLIRLSVTDCPLFNLDYTRVPSLRFLRAQNSGNTLIDISGRTATTSIGGAASADWGFVVSNSANLEEIRFPSNSANGVVSTGSSENVSMRNCPNLGLITNLENLSWNNTTGTTQRRFFANGCNLNQDFKIGINNWIPTNIELQNNVISNANVNLNINNLYQNRTKWNPFTGTKILNIGGTNSFASGVYQAPTGFVQGSNDGTPASAAEQIYVLVNNYSWTITYNTQPAQTLTPTSSVTIGMELGTNVSVAWITVDNNEVGYLIEMENTTDIPDYWYGIDIVGPEQTSYLHDPVEDFPFINYGSEVRYRITVLYPDSQESVPTNSNYLNVV
jgi:hypothetical protein